MATTPTRLMTFAEFERLPWPRDCRYELRHGELFKVPPPKYKHFLLQQKLRELLQEAAGAAGKAYTEVGFRARPEGEFRIADVAYAANERWAQPDPEGYFTGAPDLLIEILSRSNTAAEMLDKRNLCLENDCREFWVVDLDHRQVEVSTPDGHTITYKSGQEIPLFFGGRLATHAIFS